MAHSSIMRCDHVRNDEPAHAAGMSVDTTRLHERGPEWSRGQGATSRDHQPKDECDARAAGVFVKESTVLVDGRFGGRDCRQGNLRRLAPGGSVTALQGSGKVPAGLGVNRGFGRRPTPPPLQGRIFSVVLLAVDHFTRLVDAMAYLLQQF
jgi:hypothetical protein